MGWRREREIARFTATKQRLEDQFKQNCGVILEEEGISKTLIVFVLAALNIILGLILAPEAVVTKVIAAIVALGLSLWAAYVFIAYVSNNSIELLGKEQTGYNEKEEEEDNRHDSALERIGDN